LGEQPQLEFLGPPAVTIFSDGIEADDLEFGSGEWIGNKLEHTTVGFQLLPSSSASEHFR
jgi:hypothetical protein